MTRFVVGDDRSQSTLFPERLEDYLSEDNPVRAIDVSVDDLDLAKLGFSGVEPEATGRPAYHPATLLKIYVYGYLNRVQSSRRLERECQRNIELVWLTGRLMPDFKTIADFRKDNGEAIRRVCREFVVLCRRLELFSEASVAIDGSKFKAINTRSGSFFRTSEIRFRSLPALEKDRNAGADVRFVAVEGDGPLMTPEANIARLSEISAGGWDEHLGAIVGRGANVIDNQYMVVRVIDGEARGLPDTSREGLREIVAKAATPSRPNSTVRVEYSEAPPRDGPIYRTCRLDPADIFVGGSVQRTEFEKIVENADRRVIIHSTFLKAEDTGALMECFAKACRRGVEFSVLWGAEYDEETEVRNAGEAAKIMKLVAANRDMAGRFRINMRTTGSHAKIMLADTKSGDWVAAVGSCNWLKSPFRSTEVTVLLRNQGVVGDTMKVVQRIIGRRGLSDTVAEELELARRNLRIGDDQSANARIGVLVGEAHDELMREASGKAERRFVVGSHRLGSTARPGAFLPSQIAAKPGVSVTLMYSVVSKPLKSRHVRELAQEAEASGVRIVKSGKIPLHGKFLTWDDNDLVITSVNWASASSDPDFPEGEVGVHIQAAGIATLCLGKLSVAHPNLLDERHADEPS